MTRFALPNTVVALPICPAHTVGIPLSLTRHSFDTTKTKRLIKPWGRQRPTGEATARGRRSSSVRHDEELIEERTKLDEGDRQANKWLNEERKQFVFVGELAFTYTHSSHPSHQPRFTCALDLRQREICRVADLIHVTARLLSNQMCFLFYSLSSVFYRSTTKHTIDPAIQ